MRSDKTSSRVLARVKNPRDDLGWRDFVDIYDPLLYRYARLRGLGHEDAREVVQECFVLLVRELPRFNYSRAKGSFKGWLRRIANNKIHDMFKRRRPANRRTEDFRGTAGRESSAHKHWEDQWQRKHLRFCLKKVLDEVSPPTRQAFELYVVSEWSVDRVCEALGISADQVYAAKSRVTQRLRRVFRELVGADDQTAKRQKADS